MEQQLVVFELANEFYGVDIASIESIIKLQPITVVPHAPSFVEGVTNLRGTVLPVIDLRKRFDLPEVSETKNSRIVVAALDEVKIGMVVDAVSEVLRVPQESIEPTPPLVTGIDTAYITGIARVPDTEAASRLIILLDLARVLSLQEKAELTAVPVAA